MCSLCIKEQIEKYGKQTIPCSGLNSAKEKMSEELYEQIIQTLSPQEIKEMNALFDPYTYMEVFLDANVPAKDNGDNPLEVTAVHPDSYEIAENLLKEIGCKKQDLRDKEGLKTIKEKLANINIKETSKKLNTSEITLKDIIEELSKPGRDPREDMPKQILRSDVLKFEDLKEGMVLNGTVRNVIDFGAFVDIGVKHDGLVHISEMSNNYVKNPSEIVSVGDIVKVKVIGIDNEKQKVKLSMKI